MKATKVRSIQTDQVAPGFRHTLFLSRSKQGYYNLFRNNRIIILTFCFPHASAILLVFSCGDNARGQLGLGDVVSNKWASDSYEPTNERHSPTIVEDLQKYDVISITAGGFSSFALADSSEISDKDMRDLNEAESLLEK